MSSKKLLVLALTVISLSLLFATNAFCVEVFMRLTINNDPVEGTCIAPGIGEDLICVESMGWGAYLPQDATSGLPTGRRQHRPLKIVKLVDQTSPLIFRGLTMGYECEVELLFFKPDPTGALVHFFTITLENALIIGVHGSVVPGETTTPFTETITFLYLRICTEEEGSSITHCDDWLAPH